MEPTTTPSKEFEFTGTAGDMFVIFLWQLLAGLFGLFGAPLALQKTGKILASKVKINGRELKFEVSYWEAFKFLFIQTLLVVITLGIYIFWYMRNSYRFTLDHTHFADTVAANSGQTAVPQTSSAMPPPVSNRPDTPESSPPLSGPVIQ